jgi:3-oxoacyl-[acyl-carrier protein] reductase
VILVSGSAGMLALRLAEEAERRGDRVALAAPPVPEPRAGRRRGICRFPSDCGDPEGCDLLIEAVVEKFSRLDAVIATAAAPEVGALDALSMEEWQQSVIAPLRRTFWLARRVVWEFLAAGGGGRLVFVTEPPIEGPASSRGEPNEIIGAALVSLARSIAKEVGRRAVACNVVLVASGGPSAADPLPPMVEAALYLASKDASFVNGEALTVRV